MSATKWFCWAVIVCAMWFTVPAQGETVYDTFGPGDSVQPSGHIFFESRYYYHSGLSRFVRAAQRIATPFSFKSADTELRRVTVPINSLDSIRNAISLELWSDNGNKPGSRIITINSGTVGYPDNTVAPDWRTSFDVPAGTHLQPNTKYWIVANTKLLNSITSSRYHWKLSPTATTGSKRNQYVNSSYWSSTWSNYSGTTTGAMRIENVDNPMADWLNPGETSCSAGGLDFDFSNVTGEGTVSVNTIDVSNLNQESRDAMEFIAPTQPLSIWDIDFDGTFTGPVNLTFTYDDNALRVPERALAIYHLPDSGFWYKLPIVAHDMVNNRLTVQTNSFSPFALGAVPEPATAVLTMLAAGALMLRRR